MVRRGRVAELVLCRLSVGGAKTPTRGAVATSLYRYFSLHLTRREWEQVFDVALAGVRRKGLVEAERLALTAAGEAEVTRLLGGPPRSRQWRDFERRELVRLLGGPPRSPSQNYDKNDTVGPNATTVDIVSTVLARALSCPPGRSAAQTVDTWLSRSLDLEPGAVTLDRLRAALLARELGVPARPRLRDVVALGAAQLVGAPSGKPEHVLAALVASHVGAARKAGAQRRAPRSAPTRVAPGASLAVAGSGRRAKPREPDPFATRVLAAARSADTRRFGAGKAFIRSVWEQLSRAPEMAELGWDGFVAALLGAHRRGELVLSRADLVAAMDPADVRASEIAHLGATYHFINVPGAAP